MAIFNSYVSLPEGKVSDVFFIQWFPFLFVIPTPSDLGLCERKHFIGFVLMNFSLLMAAY